MERRFGRNDVLLLVILAGLCIGGMVLVHRSMTSGSLVQVMIDGELYGTYDLREEQTISVETDGIILNVIQIRDGQAQMTEADCPDQLCVHHAAIGRSGESIICLPNRVVVTVLGTKESEYDALAR
ncbi:MAG: NusG domain II-containing protein [Lachnospiraceae bacterium]|nr:NusG domain II-containing protein [Lachnospiraceae bacterium]